jgi:hypothetical protein
MNRKARRSQKTFQTLDWNCNVCRVLVCRIVRPKNMVQKAQAEETVARAFRQHVRLTGCLPVTEVQPIVIPDELVR